MIWDGCEHVKNYISIELRSAQVNDWKVINQHTKTCCLFHKKNSETINFDAMQQ